MQDYDARTSDPWTSDPSRRSAPLTYHQATRTATYGFLSALPLLVLYEGLILLIGHGQVMQVRVGADVWIKRLMATLGASGSLALSVVVLLIGGAVLYAERGKNVPLRARYFGWMVAESAAYAVVLAFIIGGVVAVLFAGLPGSTGSALVALQVAAPGFGPRLALSIGAGLYEELVFRVLLVGGLYLVLKRLFPARRYAAYLTAAVLGALVFSAVHYTGALGDPFTLRSFTFRFLFGLALNGLFLWRGFGVAAWTHALYDVMIVTGLLG